MLGTYFLYSFLFRRSRSQWLYPCSFFTSIWNMFIDGSDGKASAYNAGDPDAIPGSGRSPGEGNGNPFQYSCLENPMDGGAWWATVHGVAKSRTQLNYFTFTFHFYTSYDIFILMLIYILVFFKHKKGELCQN